MEMSILAFCRKLVWVLNHAGNQTDWWSNKTREVFMERIRCMEDQYSNYFVKEANVTIKGLHSISENIADNGGIREAYFAYGKL